MFLHFWLLRAEFSHKLRANRSGHIYIMFVYNGVPEMAYAFQGEGQATSTMALCTTKKK